MLRKNLLIALLSAGLTALTICGPSMGKESTRFRIADLQDLISYPEGGETSPHGEDRYSVALPGTELAVVLRPITEAEYNSFQIQAIGYQLIEQQMLAAAIVSPKLEEGDITVLPLDLTTFLKAQIITISGFDVFPPGDLAICQVVVILESVEMVENTGVGNDWASLSIAVNGVDLPVDPVATDEIVYVTSLNKDATLELTAKAVEYDEKYPDVGTAMTLVPVTCSQSQYEETIDVLVREYEGRYPPEKTALWRFKVRIEATPD